MRIDHVAIWVKNLEKTRTFYETYFGAQANQKYHNPTKNFSSYFLSFDSGARLEIMHKPEIPDQGQAADQQSLGIIHFAISVGSEQAVNEITERLRNDGYQILGETRWTGDGYYESVVADPEGNIVEITV
jgi:lactoylglutathione lyase